jgi:lipopolysaccharide export system protein LptC
VSAVAAPPPADRAGRLVGGTVRRPPTSAALARRRVMVGLGKRALPVVGLGLLALVALWPEIARQADNARVLYRRGLGIPESGVLVDARYRGDDDSGRPYTLTATAARQAGPERINLTAPVGDIALSGGGWAQVQAAAGVYMRKTQQLDLAGEVTLYRDDGTVVTTDAATVDLKEGVVASGNMTHVEGPFGTLDAQGFTITERGQVVQFSGPGRLVLNGGTK